MSRQPPESSVEAATWVDLLRWRARQQPDRRAYTYLIDGEAEGASLTYAELDRQARAIGAWLQQQGVSEERILLLYPPGLDFVAAFFGCLYGGAVAVPAYPPQPARLAKTLPRIRAIANDAQPVGVLTTAPILSAVKHQFTPAPDCPTMRWLATDTLVGDPSTGSRVALSEAWRNPAIGPQTLACLQYTSGSTGQPKGVMLTHGNLLHNSALIQNCGDTTPDSRGVFWLPPYHDMGLIGGILQTVFVGATTTLLSPVAFLQRPLRWLQAISDSRATHSGGPNFAYDLCVRKITPEQRATLDLSSWDVAFNGAEPIRQETLERFAAAFEPCDFRREAFYPCYGLAEATLIVSGGFKSARPIVRSFGVSALEQKRVVETSPVDEAARTFVGCGQSLQDQKIIIVDPETLARCLPDHVGEIWVAGPSIAQGYWNRAVETAETFKAYLVSTGEGPFLRTGDLGFMKDGELFITGRLKDVIIIRGVNLYPQDIERTVEQSHPALRPDCGAAFSVEVAGEERLVVVQEVERDYRNLDADEVVGSIRQAVAEHHELDLYAVALIRPGSILKTSSGKIQRYACRAAFLNATLQPVAEWRTTIVPERDTPDEPADRSPGEATDLVRKPPTAAAIEAWLVVQLSKRLGVNSRDLDPLQPFARYGLDSMAAVSLSGALAAWLGRPLPASLAYEYPTIEALARHLAGETIRSGSASEGAEQHRTVAEPIAIIGIGCRFPGAKDPEAFWRLLRDGVDAITEVPADRWDLRAFYDPDPAIPGKMNTRWGGFLEKVDQFDPHFFGISPREAVRIDPQQRLLLEVAWEALEDAGQVAERLAGTRTGVFIGISTNDYGRIQFIDPVLIDAYAATGNALSVAANRPSYLFDFQGPSIAVDTACSSSLVAVHLACQSLWNGECTMALAGGVNVILSPGGTIAYSKLGALAPDGRCKAFDAHANGTVRSEGAGVVVLKPLSLAIADGDPVYAVIRGSYVNNDGRTNGLTAPSRQAQENLLREAYRRAAVSPGQIQYVEAHGTGTFLGDPIEAAALGAVLATDRPTESHCAVGSVKTNIGHLEAAAGIAGLIKVALSLKHRAIPASVHFREPSPHIPFDNLPIRVQQTLGAWRDGPEPVIAGVSSFGFGGTNAHVVLEGTSRIPEIRHHKDKPESGGAYLLPLSARSPEALQSLARAYQNFLPGEGSILQDICYTASVRRSHHDHRLAVVGRSRDELTERLGAFLRGEVLVGTSAGRRASGHRSKVVFVFPGQGSQWFGMGRELLEQESVFRAALERCDKEMREHVDWSLLEELTADEARSRLSQIEVIQPALFAIQVALAALWRSWGIEPDAVVGHSMGEVAAAHVAGALTLDDAVRVMCRRSRLLKRAGGQGGMVAVELGEELAQRALVGYENRVSIAASNSPTSTVLSGDRAALEDIMEQLQRQDIFCRFVKADVASHSPQMDALRDELLHALEGLQPRSASVSIYSTVTCEVSDGLKFDATYWWRNLREPVRFSAAVQELLRNGHNVFLEISPHAILLSAIQEGLYHVGQEGTVLPSLRREEDERAVMLGSLGAFYTMGHSVDWGRLYPTGAQCVRLPSYPWQREHCWLETKVTSRAADNREPALPSRRATGEHPLLGRHSALAYPAGNHLWEMELSKQYLPYLDDHRVQGAVVLPASAYVEITLAAAADALGMGPLDLTEMEFQRALFLPESGTRKVQVILSPGADGDSSIHIYSRSEGEEQPQESWTLHATARIRHKPGDLRASSVR